MSDNNTNNALVDNSTYTNISGLPTMESLEATAYVPVEDSAKNGKKFNLNGVKPGTLNTDNSSAQTVNSAEFLGGTVSLHKISKTGSYTDLNDKPTIPTVGTLNTDNSNAQETKTSESLNGTVNLHKVAKTGSYNDLLNKPSIPTLGYTRVSQQVSGQHKNTGSYNYIYTINVNNKESITATLDKNEDRYSKGIVLELSDDCDDAIIYIDGNTNKNVSYGYCYRGSNNIIQIKPIVPFIKTNINSNILITTKDAGSGYETPADWDDVSMIPSSSNIASFDGVYITLYPQIKKLVVRIVADCAFYYPVEWDD